MKTFKLLMLSAFHECFGNGCQRHLDSHPELFVYPFESQCNTPYSNNIISDWLPQRYKYPEFLIGTTPEQAFYSMWDEELRTYLRKPNGSKFKNCGLVMNEDNRAQIFKEYCENKKPNGDYTRKDFVEAFFYSCFEAWDNYNRTGKEKYYVGYVPPIIFDFEKIISDFPDIKLLNVIRNPLSAFSTMLGRPFRFSLEKYTNLWNLTYFYAKTFQNKYPDNVYTIKYENLILFKQQEMQKISRWLDIEYSDTMLYPSFNGKDLTGNIYPWGSIVKGTEEENLEMARKLTESQVNEIRLNCDLMLKAYGYDDYFLAYLLNQPIKVS